MPYTAQHILHGPSGLPEDRYVNTFAFHASVGHTQNFDTDAQLIADLLEDFYTFEHTVGAGTNSIQDYLVGWLNPVAEIRVYDMDQPEPRAPITLEYNLTLAAGPSMPSEVALCASFYANRNLPRQRGRIYLGPLKTGGALQDNAVPSRPGATLIETARDACERLALQSAATLPWAVLSRAQLGVLDFQTITAGWVDDSWDTQRRRGEKATTRNTWTKGA